MRSAQLPSSVIFHFNLLTHLIRAAQKSVIFLTRLALSIPNHKIVQSFMP